MNHDIFDVHEGLLSRKVFRTGTDAVKSDDTGRSVDWQWLAYTDRQRRGPRSLMEPAVVTATATEAAKSTAAAAPFYRPDVIVYNLSTDGGSTSKKTPAAAVAATSVQKKTSADNGTSPADGDDHEQAQKETSAVAEKEKAAGQKKKAAAKKKKAVASDEATVAEPKETSAAEPKETSAVEPKETSAAEPKDPPRDRTDASDDSRGGGAASGTTDEGGDGRDGGQRRQDRRGCVDLKGLAKMRRLCCMLRTNVAELKETYESRCGGGGGGGIGPTEATCRAFYTASEHQTLCEGLRTLRVDVERLVGEVHGASGYRDEIKGVVVAYKDYETRYRSLRAVNKGAVLRDNAAATRDAAADVTRATTDNNADGCSRSWIKRYLCDPCYRMFRRFSQSC